MKISLPLCICAAALAVAGCGESQSNEAAPAGAENGAAAGGEQTIAGSLDQNSRFFQAARAVGLDSTLEGSGPYTVLVPSDDAFGQVQGGALQDPSNQQNRAEITRILTYHILPGVILAEDISKAIDNGQGSTVLATMGGETLTATKDGDTIVLTGSGGSKANITESDVKASNGAIHHIDTVLTPPAPGQADSEGAQAQQPAQGQQ